MPYIPLLIFVITFSLGLLCGVHISSIRTPPLNGRREHIPISSMKGTPETSLEQTISSLKKIAPSLEIGNEEDPEELSEEKTLEGKEKNPVDPRIAFVHIPKIPQTQPFPRVEGFHPDIIEHISQERGINNFTTVTLPPIVMETFATVELDYPVYDVQTQTLGSQEDAETQIDSFHDEAQTQTLTDRQDVEIQVEESQQEVAIQAVVPQQDEEAQAVIPYHDIQMQTDILQQDVEIQTQGAIVSGVEIQTTPQASETSSSEDDPQQDYEEYVDYRVATHVDDRVDDFLQRFEDIFNIPERSESPSEEGSVSSSRSAEEEIAEEQIYRHILIPEAISVSPEESQEEHAPPDGWRPGMSVDIIFPELDRLFAPANLPVEEFIIPERPIFPGFERIGTTVSFGDELRSRSGSDESINPHVTRRPSALHLSPPRWTSRIMSNDTALSMDLHSRRASIDNGIAADPDSLANMPTPTFTANAFSLEDVQEEPMGRPAPPSRRSLLIDRVPEIESIYEPVPMRISDQSFGDSRGIRSVNLSPQEIERSDPLPIPTGIRSLNISFNNPELEESYQHVVISPRARIEDLSFEEIDAASQRSSFTILRREEEEEEEKHN